MESELSWILLGLPLAFGLGWLASRLDLRQWRLENRQNPRAYFRGLNFLLNEQQDQAIDAFIEAVQNDPDTSELHFALGNLFRRRGEYERAVRVHEHLLARGDISQADRQRAQHALALDYLKAGLLDRADDALLKLEGTPFEQEARLARLANYERARDWAQAAQIARQLDQRDQGSFANRLAHYLCEQAAAEPAQAQALLQQAMTTAPNAARPRLELARLQQQAGQALAACITLEDALQAAPDALPLLAAPLAAAAIAARRTGPVLEHLQALYRQVPGIDLLQAIVTLHNALQDPGTCARDWYIQHLEQEPSLVAASRWIEGEKLEHEQFHPLVQRALEHAVKPLLRYRCAACGFEANQHFWQCPGCQTWDSYPARRVEEL